MRSRSQRQFTRLADLGCFVTVGLALGLILLLALRAVLPESNASTPMTPSPDAAAAGIAASPTTAPETRPPEVSPTPELPSPTPAGPPATPAVAAATGTRPAPTPTTTAAAPMPTATAPAAAPTPPAGIPPTAASLPLRPGQVLLSDDFDNSASGFPILSTSAVDQWYAGGNYMVTTKQPDVLAWALRDDARCGEECQVEVEAAQDSEGARTQVGLVIRASDSASGVVFVISPSEGTFFFYRMVNGRITPIQPWVVNTAIEKGQATNRLRVVVKGPYYTLLVNDRQVGYFYVPDVGPRLGRVGMLAGGASPATFRFDNLAIKVPMP